MHKALKPLTLRQVLDDLVRREVLDDAGWEQIAARMAQEAPPAREPWFIQLLLGMGAWIAALCFVMCLGVAGFLDEKPRVFLAWGAAFVVAATVLRNLTNHIFPAQLALALSVAGHGFVLAGAGLLANHVAGVTIAAVGLCIILYPAYRDSLHRFLSCLLASSCITAWIMIDGVAEVIHIAILAKVIAIGLVFMYRTDLHWLRPLGFAMALSVPADLFLVLLPEDWVPTHWWPANVVLASALVWLYQWSAGGWQRLREEPLVVAVVATVCLAVVTTPGVLAAIGLMVLGYARRNGLLLGIGACFFPIFLVVFYYEMQVSLLTKSYILLASGAVLLIARAFLKQRGWARLEAS